MPLTRGSPCQRSISKSTLREPPAPSATDRNWRPLVAQHQFVAGFTHDAGLADRDLEKELEQGRIQCMHRSTETGKWTSVDAFNWRKLKLVSGRVYLRDPQDLPRFLVSTSNQVLAAAAALERVVMVPLTPAIAQKVAPYAQLHQEATEQLQRTANPTVALDGMVLGVFFVWAPEADTIWSPRPVEQAGIGAQVAALRQAAQQLKDSPSAPVRHPPGKLRKSKSTRALSKERRETLDLLAQGWPGVEPADIPGTPGQINAALTKRLGRPIRIPAKRIYRAQGRIPGR